MENNQQEEWRIVASYPRYECSNLGRFRNATTLRIITKHTNYKTGRQYIRAYVGVGISGRYNYRNKTLNTTPLLAAAWLGPRPEGMQIDHIDGIKSNEAITNLEYVTQETNILRSFHEQGLHPKRASVRPYLTAGDYAEIKRMSATGISQVQIGKIMGCHNSTVSKILSGKFSPIAGRVSPQAMQKLGAWGRRQQMWDQEIEAFRNANPGVGVIQMAKSLATKLGVLTRTVMVQWSRYKATKESEAVNP